MSDSKRAIRNSLRAPFANDALVCTYSCQTNPDSFTKILSERNKLERILCLGLGSLSQGTSTRISEVQLALLLEIQILVNVIRFWMSRLNEGPNYGL